MEVLGNQTATAKERSVARRELEEAKQSWKDFLEAKAGQEDHLEQPSEKQSNKNALVPKELPAFQVKGGPIRDKTKKIHDTVRTFISAFEVQLRAYNLVPVDEHWERLFWLTCNDTQRQWFEKTLANKGLSWSEACAQLEKEHSNPFYVWRKKDEHRHLAQRADEPIRMFLERYQEVSYEANLKHDQDLVYNFVCSLLPSVKKEAWSTLTNHYGLALTSDIHQAANLIMASCGEDTSVTQSHGEQQNNGKRRYTNEDITNPKRSKNGFHRYGGCPVHPRGSHKKRNATPSKRS